MAKQRKARGKTQVGTPTKLVVRGKGDYTSEDRADLKRVVKAVNELDRRIPKISGGGIGRGVGNLFGMGDLGERLGKGAATILGMGDYKIKGNSLMDLGNANSATVPVFNKDGRRGVRVTEREFLGDINGSEAFTNTSRSINPSNPLTFPWLSTIAAQFEQWEPHGIIFHFVSTSSDFNGAGQALGTVIMATDYDVYDTTATSKVQLENMDYAQSTKPSVSAMHGIECDPRERPTELFYVGDTGPDQRFNTLGNFQLATQGMTASPVVGELWVSYDITFYKKQLSNTQPLYAALFSSTIDTATSIVGTATQSAGTSPGFSVTQLLGVGTDWYFPPNVVTGKFLLTWTTNGTASGNIGFALVGTNCTVTPFYEGFDTGTNKSRCCVAIITVTAASAKIRFPLATAGTSSVSVRLATIPIGFA